MHLEILLENLVKGLAVVSRIVPSRPQIPILGNIMLVAKDGSLQLYSNNGEIAIKTSVGAKIVSDGKMCLPARTLVELVSSLTSSKVELVGEGAKLQITAGSFQGTLMGVDSEEYPLPVIKEGSEPTLSIPATLLQTALAKVCFSVAIDQSRPALTGVYLQPLAGKIRLVSTDAFRLTLVNVDIPSGDFAPVIVPAFVLSEVSRLSSGLKDKQVPIFVDAGEILFGLEDTWLQSRLVASSYPNYEKIIPQEAKFKLHLVKQSLVSALKSAAVFAKDSSNIVRLKISPEGQSHKTILVSSSPSGQQETIIEATVEGSLEEIFIVAFNFHYLLDLLGAIASDDITAGMSDPLQAVAFKSDADPDFLHVIMPVRVEG